MKTALFECDIDNQEQMLELIATQQMRCKIRTAQQIRAMVESGAAKSERDAARMIAMETGENENTVRQRNKRGKKVGTHVPSVKNDKIKDGNAKLELSEKSNPGGANMGSGGPNASARPKHTNSTAGVVDVANDPMHIAMVVISQLSMIDAKDPRRQYAFENVSKWISENK